MLLQDLLEDRPSQRYRCQSGIEVAARRAHNGVFEQAVSLGFIIARAGVDAASMRTPERPRPEAPPPATRSPDRHVRPRPGTPLTPPAPAPSSPGIPTP